MRQLQRDGIHRLQLVGDHLDNPSFRRRSLTQSLEFASMKNQFPQERRNIHHKTLPGPRSAKPGRKYSVLIETAPDIATECGVFVGIHTARSGGTTQTPCFVRSVITPLEANSSLSSGCDFSGIMWTCVMSAYTLVIPIICRTCGA